LKLCRLNDTFLLAPAAINQVVVDADRYPAKDGIAALGQLEMANNVLKDSGGLS
jgi:hypothetical protein